MRVLHVNDHLALRGGVETYLLSAIPRLQQAGYEQAVLYGKGDSGLVERSYELSQISEPGWGGRAQLEQRLQQILDEYRPDLIHLHSIYNADAIEFLVEHRPVVLTSHDFRYLCPASSFYYRRTRTTCERSCGPGCFVQTLRHRCMTPRPAYSWKYYQRVVRVRRLFGRFRQLIAPGQDAADRFVRDGFPRDRVTVLPYFCRIAPLAVPRPVPEKPMILYLGRLSSNKGWQNFVRALGMLPEPVQGQIVGNVDAAAERELQQLTRETGTGERLTWRRWATQEEISELLQQTSVLVFPSLWPETLGIVGLEAMAHGVPVVASDIGGVPEWLREGETGYRVEPGDVSGLADRIQRIVSSTELAQRLGRQSLADLNARFLPETHLATLQQIYRNAVAD